MLDALNKPTERRATHVGDSPTARFNVDAEQIRRHGMSLTGIEASASLWRNVDLEASAGRGTTLFVRIPLSVAGSAKTGPESAELDQKSLVRALQL